MKIGNSDGENADTGSNKPSGTILLISRTVIFIGALGMGIVGVLCLVAPPLFLATIGHRGAVLTVETQILADYTGARELALAIGLLVVLAIRSTYGLVTLLTVTSGANAIDGLGAIIAGRWVQVPGAFLITVVFLFIAIWLLRASRTS